MPVSRASIRRLGGRWRGEVWNPGAGHSSAHWLKAETSTVFSLQSAVVRQVHAADQPPSDSRGTHHSASLQSAQCREALCAVPPTTDGIPVPPFADLLPASAWCHLCAEQCKCALCRAAFTRCRSAAAFRLPNTPSPLLFTAVSAWTSTLQCILNCPLHCW